MKMYTNSEKEIHRTEFQHFLEQCTTALHLPFAARRLFTGKGVEIFLLKGLERDQLIYVSCGEQWIDPQWTEAQHKKRLQLSNLASDITAIRAYCIMRNTKNLALGVKNSIAVGAKLTVERITVKFEEEKVAEEPEERQAEENPEKVKDDIDKCLNSHAKSHLKADAFYKPMKYTWQQISYDLDEDCSLQKEKEEQFFEDAELYKKYRSGRVGKAVLGYNLQNDRMISVQIQGKPFSITVIQVCAPTSDAEEAEVDQFYEGLQHLLELTPKNDVLIIMGDWDAKVGSQKITGITGKFGLGVQNEAGHRLVEFNQENTLVTANTLFQQPRRRLYTWTSPDGQHRNQIDYVLCSQRWRSSIQSVETRPGADCGSDHELLVAKFRLKLKKVGKSTRPLGYDLNHIPDEYTLEVTNRFKELDLIDRVPEELWMQVRNIVQEVASKTIPKKKKCKKANWLFEEALQIAEERREAKGRGERERYTQLNAEFQRIARRDKNAFLNEQCAEIEENNRIGRTRDLFRKIGDMKGTFRAKMGMIKDQNGRDLPEAEEIKKKWQDYTEELYKKELNVPDNHDGVVTDLKPDILECEVKWALGSLSNNKASGGDRIPAELFKIPKDNAVKVLHSVCQQIWKTQQWLQDWKRSIYIPIPKKGNAKEFSSMWT
ncbi:Craniofacial development protein 2 [Varanus komodoensis]|nr:Craniofacial development protein 2 [Varanus komodoensis]